MILLWESRWDGIQSRSWLSLNKKLYFLICLMQLSPHMGFSIFFTLNLEPLICKKWWLWHQRKYCFSIFCALRNIVLPKVFIHNIFHGLSMAYSYDCHNKLEVQNLLFLIKTQMVQKGREINTGFRKVRQSKVVRTLIQVLTITNLK